MAWIRHSTPYYKLTFSVVAVLWHTPSRSIAVTNNIKMSWTVNNFVRWCLNSKLLRKIFNQETFLSEVS